VLAHAGLDVPRVGLVQIAPIGQGNVSTTVKVNVSYNADASKAPPSLIAKFHSQVPEAAALVARYGVYAREAAVYRMFGAEPPLQTPRAYAALTSPDGTAINLVLEDLSARGTLGDQIAGCGIAEAEAVIDQLARLHRRYLNAPELDAIDWGGERAFSDGMAEENYRLGAGMFHERFADRLTAEEFAVIDGFVPLVGAWATARPRHRTFAHRDPRVDNIVFVQGADGRPSAWLIDWQCAGVDDPQFDLAYFLTGSLSVEDRRACERGLIARHARVLAEADPTYTEAAALEAYRRGIVSGLQATVGAAVAIPSTPSTDALLLALVRRNCAAVRDWDGLAALAALAA
jgi:hypothetical protein